MPVPFREELQRIIDICILLQSNPVPEDLETLQTTQGIITTSAMWLRLAANLHRPSWEPWDGELNDPMRKYRPLASEISRLLD